MRSTASPTFAEELAFLRAHRETLELVAPDGRGRIAVVPEFQGRVMTSTTGGADGPSFGFIKRELVATRTLSKGINPYGGEDRFWIGPEGGPFSLFFARGAPAQTLEFWQTPALIDSEPFELVAHDASSARFRRSARLTNFAGSEFELAIERTLEVLDARVALAELGLDASGLEAVAFESRNTLTNAGTRPWTKATGLLSIWILGMFQPSPRTTIVLPLSAPFATDLGGLVNDAYFGKVPLQRLKRVRAAGGSALLFRGDGAQRGKIGVAPGAARPIAGSWDAARGVLTLVTFTLPAGARDYVNSTWDPLQREPFRGDAVNSYNDGPSAPGAAPFGPFYELESSSPALELAPGAALEHRHRTLHLVGPRAALERAAYTALGLTLDEIERGL
ncbi:MAG: hypothetical protein EXS08_06215 [Planctomycetes bacterium]|nr:hypothetical protein [Planctomycetota bacterium]